MVQSPEETGTFPSPPLIPDRLWTPGIKRPRRESDHSSPSSGEVKNGWNFTSTPIRLNGVVLKHRNNFTEIIRDGLIIFYAFGWSQHNEMIPLEKLTPSLIIFF
jgi:hypothetical protein